MRGEHDIVLAFLTEIERFWTNQEKIAVYRKEIELAKTKVQKSSGLKSTLKRLIKSLTGR